MQVPVQYFHVQCGYFLQQWYLAVSSWRETYSHSNSNFFATFDKQINQMLTQNSHQKFHMVTAKCQLELCLSHFCVILFRSPSHMCIFYDVSTTLIHILPLKCPLTLTIFPWVPSHKPSPLCHQILPFQLSPSTHIYLFYFLY